MSIKKPIFLLPSYASACTRYHAIAIDCPPTRCRNHTRSYATTGDIPPRDQHKPKPKPSKQEQFVEKNVDPHSWPTAKPPRTTPTPYQILHLHPKAPYQKTPRFYDLVKLYHPDRHDHNSSPLPTQTRLDRYRLVVSAHALLSDSDKRRAYDLYGAGWAGSSKTLQHGGSPNFDMSPEARAACMHNATWEDWENWYQRFNPGAPPREPQKPIFLSNAAFISLVGVIAALAGVGQATRARESSKTFKDVVDAASDRAKREVNRVIVDKDGWSREERIEYFIKDRKAWRGDEGNEKETSGLAGSVTHEADVARRFR